MLLDRKRINRWSKRVALALAIVFGLSFVLLGVGSGTGVNWSDLWTSLSGNKANSATSSAPADKIKTYQAQLATDPNNYDALVGIATQYQLLQQLKEAATYYERAIIVKPTVVDPYSKLAVIYLDPTVADNTAAIRVLNQLTSLDPGNAQALPAVGHRAAERGQHQRRYLGVDQVHLARSDQRHGQDGPDPDRPAQGGRFDDDDHGCRRCDRDDVERDVAAGDDDLELKVSSADERTTVCRRVIGAGAFCVRAAVESRW